MQFIAAAYQLVPRSVDAHEACVLTFGAIHGGTSANIIPDHVEILGTVRTLSRRVAETVERRLRHLALGISEAGGAQST